MSEGGLLSLSVVLLGLCVRSYMHKRSFRRFPFFPIAQIPPASVSLTNSWNQSLDRINMIKHVIMLVGIFSLCICRAICFKPPPHVDGDAVLLAKFSLARGVRVVVAVIV